MYDELVRSLHEGAEFLECSTPGIKNFFAEMCHNAADAIEELSRENESLAKSVNEASEILRRRWIPVTEGLPKEMETVIVTDGKNVGYSFCVNDYGILDFYSPWNITHWMPLPEPPEEGK